MSLSNRDSMCVSKHAHLHRSRHAELHEHRHESLGGDVCMEKDGNPDEEMGDNRIAIRSRPKPARRWVTGGVERFGWAHAHAWGCTRVWMRDFKQVYMRGCRQLVIHVGGEVRAREVLHVGSHEDRCASKHARRQALSRARMHVTSGVETHVGPTVRPRAERHAHHLVSPHDVPPAL